MLEKASADVLNNVYSYFKELAGISEHHLSQLKDERKLSEDRIRSDYFTFPTSMKNHYICEIQKKYPNYTDDVLLHVPGFYKENGKIQFYAVKGIGILIHDLPGRVQAIQIRRDTIKEGQKRYTWFSSTFAAYDDKYEGGLSCGAPKDILLPNETRKSTLCITEGRFKSEILCAAGNIALSVQGVGAWHGIETNINEIMQIKHVSRLFLLFDTDMLGNSAVMDQMIALYNVLSSTFPSLKISAGVWAKQDGKGIDDLFINHKAVTAKFLDPSYIAETQNKQNLSLLSKYGYKSIRDIPKNKVDTFKFELQCECEKVLL